VNPTPSTSPHPAAPDRRRLGLWSAVALVVANMIGTGVFTTSGFALQDLKSRELVLLAWLVGGVVAMAGALSYGALARRMPESGGEYFFLSRTVHPLAGFLAGWVSLLAGFTAPIAAAALGLQAYLCPLFGEGLQPEWIATGSIAVAALMHGLRSSRGVALQNLAVALKVVLIGGLVCLGAARIGAPEVAPLAVDDFPLSAFSVSLVWISFAYSGWNAAVYVGGEIRDSERNLSRSLWLATAAVTVLYLALNAVFLYAAPMDALAGRAEVGAIAAEALGGTRLRNAVSILVALALFTAISSMVMIGPRVYARMAEDGQFPRILSTRGETPGAAVALQAVLAVAVVWLSGLRELLGLIGFTLGLSAAATVISLIALRQREGAGRVPVPGYPWLPALFVAATLCSSAFLVVRAPDEALKGLLIVLTGVPLYFVLRKTPGAADARESGT